MVMTISNRKLPSLILKSFLSDEAEVPGNISGPHIIFITIIKEIRIPDLCQAEVKVKKPKTLVITTDSSLKLRIVENCSSSSKIIFYFKVA